MLTSSGGFEPQQLVYLCDLVSPSVLASSLVLVSSVLSPHFFNYLAVGISTGLSKVIAFLHLKDWINTPCTASKMHWIQFLYLIEELSCLWMLPNQQVTMVSGQPWSKEVCPCIKQHLKQKVIVNNHLVKQSIQFKIVMKSKTSVYRTL